MNRQNIILNNNIFIADYYDFDELKFHHYDNFIMLRYFTYINNIAYDTDIYFIEKDIYNEYIKDIYLSKKTTSEVIAFPITETTNGYSNSYKDFNSLFNKYSLYKEIITDDNNNIVLIDDDNIQITDKKINPKELIKISNITKIINNKSYKLTIYLDYGEDVYKIYDENLNVANIKCDKINLYHPISIPNFNGIIHISSFINNITFHFLCRHYKAYKTYSETEFIKNNNKYSEYIELYIPNIYQLFNDNNNLYFNEDINIINEINEDNKNFINKNIITDTDNVYIKLSLFTQPFEIQLYKYGNKNLYNDNDNNIIIEDTQYMKTYYNKKPSVINNYLSNILSLTLYSINDTKIKDNNIYIIDNILLSNSAVFIKEYKFSLMGKLGFDKNGIISIIPEFNFPKTEEITTFKDSYKYFNNVNEEDYINFTGLENLDDNVLPEEIEEETDLPLNFVGYRLNFYSEMKFNYIFYTIKKQFKCNNINFDTINSFPINIDNIFTSWNEVPDKIYCILMFFDKFTGIKMSSNMIIITKEWIKYMINGKHNLSINKLYELNNKFTNDFNDMKIIDLKTNKMNFINNITCVVNKEYSDNKKQIPINKQNSKILYKPYFFKTQSLQNITLRENINQNIGINLSEYMTKVEAFKLLIDGLEFIEIGRNDVYVIFSITANSIKNKFGKYDIINQDDEYISTGNYNIY